MWINTEYGSVQNFESLQKLMNAENLESVKISVELIAGQKLFEQTVTKKDVQQLINEMK